MNTNYLLILIVIITIIAIVYYPILGLGSVVALLVYLLANQCFAKTEHLDFTNKSNKINNVVSDSEPHDLPKQDNTSEKNTDLETDHIIDIALGEINTTDPYTDWKPDALSTDNSNREREQVAAGLDIDEKLTSGQKHRGNINKRAIDGQVRATRSKFEKYFGSEFEENDKRRWWDVDPTIYKTHLGHDYE